MLTVLTGTHIELGVRSIATVLRAPAACLSPREFLYMIMFILLVKLLVASSAMASPLMTHAPNHHAQQNTSVRQDPYQPPQGPGPRTRRMIHVIQLFRPLPSPRPQRIVPSQDPCTLYPTLSSRQSLVSLLRGPGSASLSGSILSS